MLRKTFKISSVSGFNFLVKNILVFLIFDIFNYSNRTFYIVILIYIFIQSYFLHLKFTLKKSVGFNSFFIFSRINLVLIIVDYVIFSLINKYFSFVVISTLLITVFVHSIRVMLFAKEMD